MHSNNLQKVYSAVEADGGGCPGTMLGFCSKNKVLLSPLILEFPYKFGCVLKITVDSLHQ